MNIMLPSKRKAHYGIIDHETANKQSDKQTTQNKATEQKYKSTSYIL